MRIEMYRMIVHRVKKLIAWALAIVVVVMLAAGAWWLVSVV